MHQIILSYCSFLRNPILQLCSGLIGFAFVFVTCTSQHSEKDEADTKTKVDLIVPNFQPDSAYSYVEQQVKFGPRVPNSAAHRKCGDYLVNKMKSFGWEVIEQPFVATTYDGIKLNGRNIISTYNPDARPRILLAAHWDSRPYADEDPDHITQAVLGANDGASGVGVLMEIARAITADSGRLNIGVDIIFFDAEDWGNSRSSEPGDEYLGGFCLGSRHWATHKHIPNYSAYYGILLDMVGAKNAKFPKETLSMQFASEIVDKVWRTGQSLGYGNYFINKTGLGVGVDDHVAVNKIAHIPMIDIIHLEPESGTFFEHWHTTNDTMEHIDPATLKAVGQTVLQVLYEEALPDA